MRFDKAKTDLGLCYVTLQTDIWHEALDVPAETKWITIDNDGVTRAYDNRANPTYSGHWLDKDRNGKNSHGQGKYIGRFVIDEHTGKSIFDGSRQLFEVFGCLKVKHVDTRIKHTNPEINQSASAFGFNINPYANFDDCTILATPLLGHNLLVPNNSKWITIDRDGRVQVFGNLIHKPLFNGTSGFWYNDPKSNLELSSVLGEFTSSSGVVTLDMPHRMLFQVQRNFTLIQASSGNPTNYNRVDDGTVQARKNVKPLTMPKSLVQDSKDMQYMLDCRNYWKSVSESAIAAGQVPETACHFADKMLEGYKKRYYEDRTDV